MSMVSSESRNAPQPLASLAVLSGQDSSWPCALRLLPTLQGSFCACGRRASSTHAKGRFRGADVALLRGGHVTRSQRIK